MEGILHGIVAKIKAVFGNWHNHVDPQAVIAEHTTSFMEEAANIVHTLEAKVAALESQVAGLLAGKSDTPPVDAPKE